MNLATTVDNWHAKVFRYSKYKNDLQNSNSINVDSIDPILSDPNASLASDYRERNPQLQS